jgi:hypothetical protein
MLREGQPMPPCCPACGRPPFVVLLRRDPNFYCNAEKLERLRQVGDQQKER